MPNITEPSVAARIDRCWALYRQGLMAALVESVTAAQAAFDAARGAMSARSSANAEVELGMLGVIVRLVVAEGRDDALRAARAVAARVAGAGAGCDGLHRLGGLAVGVHAAMRVGRMEEAELHFRQALDVSQGLTADGGEDGVSLEDVCTIVGCGGLHLALTAGVIGDAATALALLDHSAATAAALGRENDVMGQYFGPEHVAATRSSVLATLGRSQEAVDAGHAVDLDSLIPLARVSLLRTMADASDQLELRGAATVLRGRADAVAPPLRRQFGLDGDGSSPS